MNHATYPTSGLEAGIGGIKDRIAIELGEDVAADVADVNDRHPTLTLCPAIAENQRRIFDHAQPSCPE